MKKTIKHLSIILCIFMLISTFVVPVSAETKKAVILSMKKSAQQLPLQNIQENQVI